MRKRALPFLLALLLTLTLVLGGCAQKDNTEPTGTEPEVTEPVGETPTETVTEPSTTEPTVTEPATTTPETTTTEPAAEPKPATTKPATKPSTTKPTTTKPIVTEPEKTEPAEEPVVEEPVIEEPTRLPQAIDNPAVTIDKSKVMDLSTDKGLLTIRYFLLEADTKAGDSILIHTPGDKFILIDGGVTVAGPQVVEKLKALGVTRLHALINTHPHVDHLGGFSDIIKNIQIDNYYKNVREYNLSSAYTRTMTDLQSKGVPVTIVKEGDTIDLGDGMKFDVLNPAPDMDPNLYVKGDGTTNEDFTTQLNQESLGLMLIYNEVKIFLCGDLYQMGELELVNRYADHPEVLDADIVHAPHHGAATSSSNDYLLATDPLYVIMSTNGLQSLGVYEKYALYGSTVVSNFLNGNLLITTDGTKDGIRVYVEQQTPPEEGVPAAG